MPFKIVWDNKVLHELNKLDPLTARRIIKSVKALEEDPFSKDVKKLRGSEEFRLRVGDYRVIFDIDKDTILILKVGHRQNIYG